MYWQVHSCLRRCSCLVLQPHSLPLILYGHTARNPLNVHKQSWLMLASMDIVSLRPLDSAYHPPRPCHVLHVLPDSVNLPLYSSELPEVRRINLCSKLLLQKHLYLRMHTIRQADVRRHWRWWRRELVSGADSCVRNADIGTVVELGEEVESKE